MLYRRQGTGEGRQAVSYRQQHAATLDDIILQIEVRRGHGGRWYRKGRRQGMEVLAEGSSGNAGVGQEGKGVAWK